MLGLSGNSNPDLKVGEVFIDVKSPFGASEINQNASKSQRQNAIVCITDDHCVLEASRLDDYARNLFRSQGYHMDTAYFVIEGHLYKCNRQDFI
jgi:hypothetical protein